MLRRMRDLLKVMQPDLVTPEGTLVFPGVSLTEPSAAKGSIGPLFYPGSLIGLGSYTEEGPFSDASPIPPPEWYLGHNSLPSSSVNQKFPLPPSHP